MMGICMGQWKIKRCCVQFCFPFSEVSRGAGDNNRKLMIKAFKLWILQNLTLDGIFSLQR